MSSPGRELLEAFGQGLPEPDLAAGRRVLSGVGPGAKGRSAVALRDRKGRLAWPQSFLTGRIRSADELDGTDFRRNSPRFAGDNFKTNWRIVEVVEQVAAEIGAAPAQIALAWLLAQGGDIVPIRSERSRRTSASTRSN